jgi:hypothetical protein
MADFTILARPRIHEDTFRLILRRHRSPAASEAHRAYAAIVAHGVDPALALAVFQHESSFGRAGAAVPRRNWGNLRRSPSFKSEGGFVRYPSWSDGAGDAARLLAIYGRNLIRPRRRTSTARTFPHVWAPSSDGNAPTRYGRAIVAAMQGYIAEDQARHPGAAPADDRGATHGQARPKQPSDDGRGRGDPVKPRRSVGGLPLAYVTILDRSRIRTRPRLDARVLRVVPAGVHASVDRVRTGAPYEVNGRHADTWLRIRAINGVTLPGPVFSASILWAREGTG